MASRNTAIDITSTTEREIVSNSRAKTPVWNYFGFPGNGHGEVTTKAKVICCLCPLTKEMPYKNNTTNLYTHLEQHHKEEYVALRANSSSHKGNGTSLLAPAMRQPTMAENLRRIQPLGKTAFRYKQLVEATAKFIYEDMQPLSVVEGHGFRHLMAIAEPRFAVPSRTYFTQTELPKVYVEMKQKVHDIVSSGRFHSVTTDLWTSQYQVKGYLTLTTHFIDSEWVLRSFVLATVEVPMEHTAENIKKVVTDILLEYGIEEKVIAATTDNGTNVVKAIELLEFFHMPCVGHTLNLAVKKCFELNQVARALARVRKLVGHFHRSTKAMSKLREKQQLLGVVCHQLINDCVTRWGSTYDMLTRFVEQQQAICAALLESSSRDDRHLMPTDAEISIAEKLIVVLKAFDDGTEIMSGEKYPTIGLVRPLLKKVEVILTDKEDDTTLVKQIKGAIKRDIDQRYLDDEISVVLTVAMFLEPRFKEMPFLTRREKEVVKQTVKSELQTLIEEVQTMEGAQCHTQEEQEVGTSESFQAESEPQAKKKKLELFFEDIMGNGSSEGNQSAEEIATAEVDRYIAESAEKLNSKQPLLWWKLRASSYKYLSLLAQKILSVTATSVASERIFSTAGNVINEKRSRLTPENVNKLVFLYENTNRL